VGLAHLRALAFSLLVVVPAIAHEIGTTQVTARFNRDHTYEVDVVTLRHSNDFAQAAEIRFGGVRVNPEVQLLPNNTIRFRGEIPKNAGPFTWRWKLTYASYALSIAVGRGARQEWLDADATSTPFPLSADVLPPSRMDVVRQYLKLGFTHIVPGGLDHILFVLGIFLLSTKLRPVLTQVTAFTIAHSITLGLTIYGLVSVSPRIVEPMIALSIAYVAIENMTTSHLRPWRVAIVFAFGLLHGMGFAGVLKELGLPRSEFLTALVTFNVGVECGQLAVIGAAFVLVAWWARAKPWYRPRFVVPASAAIAATGIFWTVQRLM
jgi:hydrogenase/urease accessory protein HupE